jgi:hypothetical protein
VNAPTDAASSTPIKPDVKVIENTHEREITNQRVKVSASWMSGQLQVLIAVCQRLSNGIAWIVGWACEPVAIMEVSLIIVLVFRRF